MGVGQEEIRKKVSFVTPCTILRIVSDSRKLEQKRIVYYNVRNFRTFPMSPMQASMVSLNLEDIFLQRKSMFASDQNNTAIETLSFQLMEK